VLLGFRRSSLGLPDMLPDQPANEERQRGQRGEQLQAAERERNGSRARRPRDGGGELVGGGVPQVSVTVMVNG
jgi:hypothetical protein